MLKGAVTTAEALDPVSVVTGGAYTLLWLTRILGAPPCWACPISPPPPTWAV